MLSATLPYLVVGGLSLAWMKSAASFVSKLIAALVLLVVVAAAVDTLERGVAVTDVPSSPADVAVAEPTADAIPIPWAATAPRWPDTPRCAAGLDPQAVLPALQARLDALHALRSGFSPDRGVTAMLRAEDRSGRCLDFVATQTNVNVERAMREALAPGEQPVWEATGLPERWREMHAEQKAVHAAFLAGFRPVALVASAPFCSASRDPGRTSCQAWLALSGATKVTERQAVWRW